jgi:phosphate transport system substrate-binding protein
MSSSIDFQQALEAVLPKEHSSQIPILAEIFSAVVQNTITPQAARERISANPDLARVLEELAGKQIATAQAILSFGEGSQLGDVAVRDVVGRDAFHFTVNIYQHQNSQDKDWPDHRLWRLVVIGALAGLALLVVLGLRLIGGTPTEPPFGSRDPTTTAPLAPISPTLMTDSPATPTVRFGPTVIAAVTADVGAATTTIRPEPGVIVAPAIAPTSLSGDIVVAGSSTMASLTERLRSEFATAGFPDNLTIEVISTAPGFERLCALGSAHIVAASRPIQALEEANCIQNGRSPLELRIATYAIVVVVSQANSFLEGIDREQLARAFNGEVTRWSELDPDYPAEPITLFGLGEGHVAGELFDDMALGGNNQRLLASGATLSADSSLVAGGVAANPYAVGYLDYSAYRQYEYLLRPVAVDGALPTVVAAETEVYPFVRPLFFYVDAGSLAAEPQVAGFLSFALERVDGVALAGGFLPVTGETLERSRHALREAVGN